MAKQPVSLLKLHRDRRHADDGTHLLTHSFAIRFSSPGGGAIAWERVTRADWTGGLTLMANGGRVVFIMTFGGGLLTSGSGYRNMDV